MLASYPPPTSCRRQSPHNGIRQDTTNPRVPPHQKGGGGVARAQFLQKKTMRNSLVKPSSPSRHSHLPKPRASDTTTRTSLGAARRARQRQRCCAVTRARASRSSTALRARGRGIKGQPSGRSCSRILGPIRISASLAVEGRTMGPPLGRASDLSRGARRRRRGWVVGRWSRGVWGWVFSMASNGRLVRIAEDGWEGDGWLNGRRYV